MKKNLLLSALCLVGGFACASPFTNSAALFGPRYVSFEWDASPSPQAVGYNLYAFSADPAITNTALAFVWSTTNTTYTVTNQAVAGGAQFWFCVTAKDAQGSESIPSNVLSYQLVASPGPIKQVTK